MRAHLAGGTLLLTVLLAGCTTTVDGTASPAATTAPEATATPPSTSSAPTGDEVDCDWDVTPDPATSPADLPDTPSPATGTVELRLGTTQGDLVLTLDRTAAPCAAAALVSLAEQGWLDGSPCHRLTTDPSLQVLQCGDPSGTGTGGPGFGYATEVTGEETYPRGTVAMANAGDGTDGSQFFLVQGQALIPPSYTVVGTVDAAGLAVLDAVAAGGVADGSADGEPALPVVVERAVVED